jgi:hypothetical protein
MPSGLIEFTGKSGRAWRQPLVAMFGYGHMEVPGRGMGLLVGASFVPVSEDIVTDYFFERDVEDRTMAWLWGDARFPGMIIAGNYPDNAYGGTACFFVHVTPDDLGPSVRPVPIR